MYMLSNISNAKSAKFIIVNGMTELTWPNGLESKASTEIRGRTGFEIQLLRVSMYISPGVYKN
jgi:hypothetical protein